MMMLSFAACLLAFLLLGIYSARFSNGTAADYYLASRHVRPFIVGLSAVATNNSGYMFIGVIGYTYTTGLAAV
jgi:sodium/proline symporter